MKMRCTRAGSAGRQRGYYSISKLNAFEAYQNSTSVLNAMLAVMTTPLPCVLVVLLLECNPLQDLALRW